MSTQLEHGHFDKLSAAPGGLLIYRNALLIVTVLGGVKLEGLDRMRVTLKVEIPDSPRPPVRHNLDLYNDNQLGKLVRVIAARLEVGMSVTEACLAELIEALEACPARTGNVTLSHVMFVLFLIRTVNVIGVGPTTAGSSPAYPHHPAVFPAPPNR